MRGTESAMTDAQLRGMRRFERVGCINCHNGPMFSDYTVHVLGVGRRGRARNAHVSREQLDPLVRQLRDPDDRAGDLIAFLEALSDDSFDRTVPAKVPSGLKPGGNIE